MEWNKTALSQRQFRWDLTKSFLVTRTVIQRNSSKGNWEPFFMVIKKQKQKRMEGSKKRWARKQTGELSPGPSAETATSAPQAHLLVSLQMHWRCSHPLSYSFVLAKRDSVSTLTIQFANHGQGEAGNKLNGTRSCRSRAADPPHVVEPNNSESRTCGAARQLYNLGTKWLDRVHRCGVKVISGQKMSLWGKDPCHSFFWDWCQYHVDNKTQMWEKRSLLVLERGWEGKSYIKEGRGPGDPGSCFNLSLLF